MKHKFFLIFSSLLLICLTTSNCKKHKTIVDPVSQLPPETQVGANTFGCLVDGKVFVPKGGGVTPILTCYYQYIYYPSPVGYVFQVAANNKSETSVLKSIYILCDSIRLEERGVYKLQNEGGGRSVGNYSNYTISALIDYFTYLPFSGELTLKKFDEINQIASGTFWFNAVSSNGDTVHVTDGRFDMQFTK